MSYNVEIHGKEYFPASAIAREFGYTADYITRLAREQKISATRIGRQWFVEPKSIRSFSASMEEEKVRRRRKLQEVRRAELRRYAQGVVRPATGHTFMKTHQPLLDQAAVSKSFLPVHRNMPRLTAALQTAAVTLTGLVLAVVIANTELRTPTSVDHDTISRSQGTAVGFHTTTSELSESLMAFSLGAFFGDISHSLSYSVAHIENFFSRTADDIPKSSSESSATDGLGMVVVPAEEYTKEDIEAIRNSFSDDVEVEIDPYNPDSGVIKPIFKEREDEQYHFLLVPVRGASP